MHEERLVIEATSKRIRIYAIIFALVSGLFILALKFYAAHVSDSSALRSDALEGTVNVLAAAFGLGSILFAEKPADRDHPYGHGKIEYFASVFEGGLISLAGFLILIDTGLRLLNHTHVDDLGSGLKWNLLGGLLNGIVGAVIYFAGKRHESQVLIADGVHLLTDLVTTIILGLGLVVVLLTGWTWLDPILALGVAFFLFKTGFALVGESSQFLLDAENPALLRRIVDHLNHIDRGNVITIHELRTQQFGRDKHVDIHLVIPEYLTVKQAHDASDHFMYSLRKELGPGSLVHTHIDPCEQLFCKECPMKECAIRLAAFEHIRPITIETAVKRGAI